MATLTGAARVALGPEVVPFYTDDDALAADAVAQRRCAERSAVAAAAVAALRPDARFQGRRRQQCRDRRLRRLDHGGAVPAPLRFRRQGLAAFRHLSPGTRPPSRAGRKAANARPRARSIICSRHAMADAPQSRRSCREVVDPQAPVRRSPAPDAPLDTEALKGERVVGRGDQRRRAGAGAGSKPTAMRAGCRRTRWPRPGRRPPTRSRCPARWCFRVPRSSCRRSRGFRSDAGSPSRASTEPFAITHSGGYVPARHLAPIDAVAPDFGGGRRAVSARAVSVGRQDLARARLLRAGPDRAHRLRDRPARATATCRRPRSASPLSPARGLADLRRGDLLFWQGHVAIARDRDDAHPRQRVPHGGRDRADRRGDRPHRGGRQRLEQRAAAWRELTPGW